MRIEAYIGQLLYKHQCVIIPNFGAFLTTNQSSLLIENSHGFFPPKKQIAFNINLKNNDGLLANHIAQAEECSYEKAVNTIQDEVLGWKKVLEETGFLFLKNIGSFSLYANGNIIFTPDTQCNYLKPSFGLTTFISPVIKRELFEQELNSLGRNKTIQLTKKPENNNSLLQYAAAFVIGLGLMGVAGYPFYQEEQEEQKKIVETIVQRQVQNKIQEATFFIKEPLIELPETESDDYPYHIVAGSFRDEKNAEQVLKELKAKGYLESKFIGQNQYGLFSVIYGSYATYSEAEKVKKTIEKSEENTPWILIESL